MKPYRGYAGRPSELKWLPTSPIFSCFFCHFEGQQYWTFYDKSHRHYCNLIADQVLMIFDVYYHTYLHNKNELTKLKPLISGHNFILCTNPSTC